MSYLRRTLFQTSRVLLRSSPSSPLAAASRLAPLFSAATTTPSAAANQIRRLSDETRRTIEGIISTAPVVLFMKGTPETPACGFSKASVRVLGLQGVDPDKFAAYNVLEDDEVRQGIKEYSSWPTIPQLFVNKEFIGGCDILVSMHQSGELAELLEKENVLAPEEPPSGQEQGQGQAGQAGSA